eukprot:CAMPEP_0203667562 /NCGR_PEP_ID=MMETSP0090-20130426/4386_1 /ASSEMBLY_ACC=CAM_ASM_001088 /TAXON_ID=426623 /ORGANISM="Chaetoceros affinis, Strain CCMP159" /LENGTH=57 /DNA_ID=CAMNT_0050531765 /DNA_START=1 /DNA_END=171 /DNA_ORIENTATION=+
MTGRIATTKLSIEKVSLLLQGLLDVKNNDSQKDLPKDVEELVDNLLKAQEAFVDGID